MNRSNNLQTSDDAGQFASPINVNYKSLMYRLLKNWYWFPIALAICLTIAYFQVKYTVPVYSSSATFIIQDPTQDSGVSPADLGSQFAFTQDANVEDELNVLTSRSLLAEVVMDLGINLSMTHLGDVRNTLLYKPKEIKVVGIDTFFAAPDEIEYGSVDLISNPEGEHFIFDGRDTTRYYTGAPFKIGNRNFTVLTDRLYTRPLTEQRILRIAHRDPVGLAGSMVRRLGANLRNKSNTVDITYSDVDPQLAADVVSSLMKIYNGKILDERSQTGEKTVAFLEGRLDVVKRDLFGVEASITNLREREGIIVDNSTRGNDYLSQLNLADAQLSELEVRKSLIRQISNQLDGDGYPPLSIASEIIDGTLAQLVSRYNVLIFERDQRLEVVTTEHPQVITVEEQLADLKSTLVRSINTLLRETEERSSRVAERVEPIERGMQAIPNNERRLLQVEREQQIKQNLFIYLMEKREEAAITVAAQIPNTRVIDPPRPNRSSIYPKPTQNYVGAFALGIFIPALLILLSELLNKKIKLEEDVAKRTSQPIVGRIADAGNGQDIIVTADNQSGTAETFRLLRTNLNFILPANKTPVVLATSSVSGEGKTFIVANLGNSVALSEKKTLLIGADMRKPKLGRVVLGPGDSKQLAERKSRKGLSNYLIGEADYEAVVQSTEYDNLFLIDSGPVPPNPSELLMSPRIVELLERCREDFDIVFIDAPPIGLVTDALVLSPLVDLTMYAVRLNHTPLDSLQVVNDLVDKNKLPKVSIVLNGLVARRDYGYGHGQGYYK